MAIRVLGISGSLRRESFNTKLLHNVAELMPEGMTLEIADISGLAIYNEDDQTPASFPPAAIAFREQIVKADALLISAPEYNHSISAALKNAIEWASRPDTAKITPLSNKPTAIMGVSTGGYGTARAQAHLRNIFAATNTPLALLPEVQVTFAAQKFDESGRFTDEAGRKFLAQLLITLQRLHAQVNAPTGIIQPTAG